MDVLPGLHAALRRAMQALPPLPQSIVATVTLLLPIPVSFLVLGPFKQLRAWAAASLLVSQLLRLSMLGTNSALLQCLSLVLGCSLLEGAAAAEAVAGMLQQLGLTGLAKTVHPSSPAAAGQHRQQHLLDGLEEEDRIWGKGWDGYEHGSPLTPRSDGSPGMLHFKGYSKQQKGGLVSQLLQSPCVKQLVKVYTRVEQQPLLMRGMVGVGGAAALTSLIRYGKMSGVWAGGAVNGAAANMQQGVLVLKPQPEALERWVGVLLPVVWAVGGVVMAADAALWLLELVEQVKSQQSNRTKPLIEAEQVMDDGEGIAGDYGSPGAGPSTPTASVSFGGARPSASAAGKGVGGSIWGIPDDDVRIVTPKVKPPRKGEYTFGEVELHGDGLVEVDQPSRTGGKGKTAGRGRGKGRGQGSRSVAARKAAAAADAAAVAAAEARAAAVATADAADVALPEDDQAVGSLLGPVRTGSLQAAVAAAAAGAVGVMAGHGVRKAKASGWGSVVLGVFMCGMVLGSYWAGGIGLYTQEGRVKHIAR